MTRRKSKQNKRKAQAKAGESGSPTAPARRATATTIVDEDLTDIDSGSEKSVRSPSPKPAKPQQATATSTKKPTSVSDDGNKATETPMYLDEVHYLPFGPSTCENKVDIKFQDINRPNQPPFKLTLAPTDIRLLEYCCPRIATNPSKTITGPAIVAPSLQSILHWVYSIQGNTKGTNMYRYKPYRIQYKETYTNLAELHAAATMLKMGPFGARLLLCLKTTDIKPKNVPWLYKDLGLASAGVKLIVENLAAEYVFRGPRTGIRDRFFVKDILNTVSLCEATREGFNAAFTAEFAKIRGCRYEERREEVKKEDQAVPRRDKAEVKETKERKQEKKKTSESGSVKMADEKVKKRDRRENEGGSCSCRKKGKDEAVVRAPLDAPVRKHEVRRAPDGLLYVVKPSGSKRMAAVTGLAALRKALS